MPHEFTETVGDSQLTATAAPNKVDSVPERQAVTEADLHAEVDSVAGEVVAEAAMRRRTITRCGIAIIALTMVLYFGLFAGLFLVLANRGWVALFVACYASLAAVTIGVGLGMRGSRKSRELKRRRVEFLAAQNNVVATGAMLDVLAIERGPVGRTAARALTRVAPLWTDEVVARLTAEQRTMVRRLMRGVNYGIRANPDPTDPGSVWIGGIGEYAQLRIALCAGLSRTGSQEDLRVLRQVAAVPVLTSHSRKVRAAAMEAVAQLEARMAELNRPHTLMRASCAPDARAEELLRAAAADSSVAPDELLRAADGESQPIV